MKKAFECKMCGACCYGKGGIIIDSKDLKNISRFLQIEEKEFMDEFCEIDHGKISVICGPDNACIFYDEGKGCLIHPVKPEPCRRWPFYPALLKDPDNWEYAKDACPGISRDCSYKEFIKQAQQWLSSNS